ncbi:Alpha/Beta hydrolase protein [Penicillium atrosanguineum]|uniref:Uncharacterized protein n=1 Tax=Penicillium atrosanguineum TaxID=1132637 RepID=A0A9W9Q1F7_9EURO|nr:Alpha/Beta hydrolase protein [Penicillium atrosanguineum]KAJ5142172.1 hypothetical protein N7526_003167 [Penicillium atrosanguineum]KAJ5298766.1 Alpha/Beta hydrolase protein [Penicillium atrosanguineum]KAJ5320969.1 hypothetical protein N7476_003971 [Penicillium atrosanguineum]
MDTHTETYTKLPSSRQSRMKIDSLLNPPTDSVERDYQPVSPCETTPYQQGYPPSPGYWRYQGYHDTSPGATSTATTHASSNSAASMHHHHHMFLSYRPSGSAHSSPDPYQPRERYDSVSSSSSTNADRRRPPRPKYEEEEMYFIWYHRVDLCQEWKEVRESFNRQFPSRQRRGFQGIQCKFYRFIKEKKCPTLREQRRMRDGEFLREGASLGADSAAPRFGVIEWANVWYPWMREDRETALQMQREHQARQQA